MNTNTQMNAILNHLKTHGSITSMEAFQLYGCTRLSARIYDLRNLGYTIDSVTTLGTTRYGTPCSYANYVLAKELRSAE